MRNALLACALITGFTSAVSAEEKAIATYYTNPHNSGEKGLATYYTNPHYSGLIAAHRSLPLGTQELVVNIDNGHSVIVTIVDRGPFIRGRIIDVSTAAAGVLGFRQAGLAHVRISPI